ncbi:phosphatidate cytidylyltransferase [Mucilaginibacter robiniae]|uniref:Phosphatidate cytidylyltransferase n=1 Tax=Mucilaginibacter robiniae TaxID=2728022 RepID=A0A7L5EC03_9SPHI|nr:phosphatidate cytidylyltransferase [Mucilaginibacter robiniae]QJD97946.1 phosphatidate cytidylyltransferase [Mucilaginibacter robiniae]
MKNLSLVIMAALVFTLSSCSAIAGIFKAGAAVGIIAVLVVIFIIIWIISMFRGRS